MTSTPLLYFFVPYYSAGVQQRKGSRRCRRLLGCPELPQGEGDKERCASMMQAISQHLQNSDLEDDVAPWLEPALEQILDKLSIAASAYQQPLANTPSNKKIEKQFRFVSTKRKPNHAAPGKMATPTIPEQKAVQDVLKTAGGSGGQHTAFDHTY